jgi:uncharacterized protein YbaP (TraB family)
VKARALLLLALMLVSCAVVQPKRTAERRAEKQRKVAAEKPAPALLWEVKNEVGVIYLFGTMHFGVQRDELPVTVGETLARCSTFVLESDPNSADQRKLADLMMLPQGPGLDEQLGAERWEKLMSMLGGMFEERTARRLRPWVLEAAIIGRLLPTQEPMESSLLQEAASNQMAVEYLEDWETQIAMLNDVSTLEALGEILDDPEGFSGRTKEMGRDYVRGDLTALEAHIFSPDYPSEALFADRNEAWLPRIDELVAHGSAFVAVGAGHLVGPENLLTMLRERGYEVRRLD